jgi:hypothetical protein
MTEPWAGFGPMDQVPGLATPLVALIARSEAAEVRREQRDEAERRAELEDRAEARLHYWMVQRAQQLSMEGRPFNPADPSTLVMPMDEQADRVFRAEDREAARAELRGKIERGEVHVLNIPADAMAVPRQESPPDAEELADRWCGRMQQRTEHAASSPGFGGRSREG